MLFAVLILLIILERGVFFFSGCFTLLPILVCFNTLMRSSAPISLYSTQGFLVSISFSYSPKHNSFTEIIAQLHALKNKSTTLQHRKFQAY